MPAECWLVSCHPHHFIGQDEVAVVQPAKGQPIQALELVVSQLAKGQERRLLRQRKCLQQPQ